MLVKKRDGKVVEFDSAKIIKAVGKAFNQSQEVVRCDLEEVVKYINDTIKDDVKEVEQIQDRIVEWLLKEGYHKTGIDFIKYRERRSISRGTSVDSVGLVNEYLGQMDDMAIHENSSSMYSLQGLNNHIFSSISEKYWLSLYSDEIKEAHDKGRLHINDLSTLGPYCCGWDLKQLIIEGFGGVNGKPVSKPPKHFSSALNQANNFIFTLQGESSGAQAFSNFNTILAPFVRHDDLSYNQVKQEIQQFIFNLNISTRVGFQCLSEDTVILGEEGWVNYKDVKVGSHIATFNMDKKEIEYKKVINVFAENYKGSMIHFVNEDIDQLVTPNHRVVKKIDDMDYVFEEAGNVKNRVSLPVLPHGFENDLVFIYDVEADAVEFKNYDGIVWCPTTENQTVIAKRNDKIFITGNSPFSNITLDLDVTKTKLADEPAIIGGEMMDYSFGDCAKEATWINQAVVEVLSEGDGNGAMLSYPIVTLNVTKDFPWRNKLGKSILESTAKYGSYYFSNSINSDYSESDITSMCPIGAEEKILHKSSRGFGLEFSNIHHLGLSKSEGLYEIYSNGKFVKGRFQKHYNQKFIKLTLANGQEITISKSHMNYILENETSKMSEVLGCDLKIGDHLPFSLNSYEGEGGNYDLGYLVGLYAGDGTIDDYGRFTLSLNSEKDYYIVEKLKPILMKYFGASFKTKLYDDSKLLSVFVNSEAVCGYCREFVKEKKTNKFYDPNIFGMSMDFRKGVIDGHLDTDGDDKRRISTSSIEMVSSLNMLSATMGTFNSVKADKRGKIEGRYSDSIVWSVLPFILNRDKYSGVYFKKDGYAWVPIVSIEERLNDVGYCFEVIDDEPMFTVGTSGILTHNCRLKISHKEIQKHLGQYTGGLSEDEYNKTHQKGHGFFGASPNTGSIGVVTLGIPSIMHDVKELGGNWNDFLIKIKHYMDLSAISLMKKRKIVEEKAEKGLYPYLMHYLGEVKKRTGHYFTQHFSTICTNGVHEALYIYGLKDGIMCEEGMLKAEELLKFMNEYTVELQKEHKCLFNLEQAPAESSSVKMCQKSGVDPFNNGYYTNSTWQPADSDIDVVDLIKMQSRLNQYYSGGSSMHTYTQNDLVPIAQDLEKLIMYAFTETKLPYMTISPVFTVCPKCGRIAGKHKKCPKCGNTNVDIYERIVGYYRSHRNWNKGRLKESSKRKYLDLKA